MTGGGQGGRRVRGITEKVKEEEERASTCLWLNGSSLDKFTS